MKNLKESNNVVSVNTVIGADDLPPSGILMGHRYKNISIPSINGKLKNIDIDDNFKWNYFDGLEAQEDQDFYLNTLDGVSDWIGRDNFDLWRQTRAMNGKYDDKIEIDYGKKVHTNKLGDEPHKYYSKIGKNRITERIDIILETMTTDSMGLNVGDDDFPVGNVIIGHRYRDKQIKSIYGTYRNFILDDDFTWDFFYGSKGQEDQHFYSDTLDGIKKWIKRSDFDLWRQTKGGRGGTSDHHLDQYLNKIVPDEKIGDEKHQHHETDKKEIAKKIVVKPSKSKKGIEKRALKLSVSEEIIEKYSTTEKKYTPKDINEDYIEKDMNDEYPTLLEVGNLGTKIIIINIDDGVEFIYESNCIEITGMLVDLSDELCKTFDYIEEKEKTIFTIKGV